MSLDTDILIIGGGPSGLGMAIQLIRKFGYRNFTIIEKADNVGGTWYANTYPGCGCDVPSHFYSFSFALNPNWSRTYALQPEIHQYFVDLVKQYNLLPHARLNTTVETATWDATTGTWLVTVHNQQTRETKTLRTKILISAVGSLSVPQDCTIPGASTFQGPLFHSARWDHTFDPTSKRIVVIGNGCSATQFVPILSETAAHLTQFSRQPHWLAPRPNPPYTPAFKALLRYVPGLMRAYRWLLFLEKESQFSTFYVTRGARARDAATREQTEYIRSHAPPEYADALVPKTVLGCKRKVLDTDYLACLHRPNVTLVHSDPVARITPRGVETASGQSIPADAIVLATGFKTQQPLFPMRIVGGDGRALEDHWRALNDGSPCAYFGTQLAGFPNFFVLMGPNTVSGHLSVLFTTECQIAYILKLVAPILEALHPRALSWRGLLGSGAPPDVVDVKREAEVKDVEWVARKTRGLVWATGCSSWGVDERTGKNTMMWPDWQVAFWWRSVWPRWKDLVYTRSKAAVERERGRGRSVWPKGLALLVLVGLVMGGRKALEMGYAERVVVGLRSALASGVGLLREVAPKSLRG